MINAPSLANCNIFTIGEEIDEKIKGGVHLVLVDISDGHYVPNILFPLSIVKHIVNFYHGTIRVTSQLEEGTEFTVAIPLNWQDL